jgi:hypothetical protein
MKQKVRTSVKKIQQQQRQQKKIENRKCKIAIIDNNKVTAS